MSAQTTEHLATLFEIAQTLNSSLDLDEVLNLVIDQVTTITGAERGFLMLRENDGRMSFRVARGIDRQQIEDPSFQVSRSVVNRVAATGEPVLTDNAAEDSRFSGLQSIVLKGLRSILCVPLRLKGRTTGLVYVDNRLQAGIFDKGDLDLLAAIASQAAVAIENARLYRVAVEKGRMEQELRMAREIQRSLLPSAPPSLAGYDVAADWQAAREVAGDFYDFIANGRQMGVLIADVSDKGAPAAIFMAVARNLIRAAAAGAGTPLEAIRRANQLITAESRSGMFVTAFYLALSPDDGLVQYVNAGHNLPILRRANGELLELHKGGMALGWFDDNPLIQDCVEMEPGDLLVLYTDGVTDACNTNVEEYGIGRLKATLSACNGLSAQQALARIRNSVSDFAGDAVASDDITLVAIRRI
ncbi:MAG: SpoIIE family protein phosphatase [Anaerolineales bacterium]|nr:SpoIIE family protein phosphatase [Anaerolineales bacterium]